MTYDKTIKKALEQWKSKPFTDEAIEFADNLGIRLNTSPVAFYAGYKAALDSLAESKPLDPRIQAAVQENFWELAGKPKVAKPSDGVEELCHQIYDVLPISPCLKLLDDGKLYALITARLRQEYDKAWNDCMASRCLEMISLEAKK